MYDLIIIGGGISGLHTAYRLQDQYKILILEKESCLGGRIFTVDFHGHNIEAGAGRLNQTHKLFRNLINELDISVFPIPGKITYVKDGEPAIKDVFRTLDPVLKESKKMKIETLQQYTFIDYAKTILSNQEISFIKGGFGYYEQLLKMNAYDAVKLFDKGMHSKNNFFAVKDGMSQVIEKLNREIKDKCTVKCNTVVSNINYTGNKFTIKTNKKTYESKYCVCAIPKLAMEKISFFNPLRRRLNTIGVKRLCRMYAVFKKKDIWFADLPKTTVNNELRYIIPIDKEKGIIMISYTDSKFAKFWASLPETQVIPTLQSKMKEALGIDIPRPKYVKAFYWETGTAYWKPKYDSRELYHSIQQPYSNVPLYICGENFSQNQGWVEGALESSFDVIKTLK
jgi:monoamine oxidase